MNSIALTMAVPTYQNFKQLCDCLHTFARYVEFPAQIIVVNNGPAKDADGAALEEKLREVVPYNDLIVHQAEENLGWQKSINLVFQKYCDTPLFCMANDDLLFLPYQRSFLRALAGHFRHRNVGAVGPCTNYVMGSQSLWDHRGGIAFQTTLLIGFFMLVRSKLFSEIGGLDEELPGGDDLDLSILIRDAGYKLLVDRSCYVHHIGSQTGPRVHQNGWNTTDHIDVTNNMIIRKHGVRKWYETLQSRVEPYEPISLTTDVEGDIIRSWITGLDHGLDLGCGANKTIENAIGVDRDEKGKAGHSGGRKCDASVADIASDVCDLPFDNASQDFVIARHLLEHLIDPIMAIQEWKRVLKPGGTLCIAVPNEESVNTILIDFEHVHAYTRDSLARLLRTIGFDIEAIESPPPSLSIIIKATKRAANFGFVPRSLYLGNPSIAAMPMETACTNTGTKI